VPDLKPIAWLGDSLARLREASADIRAGAGVMESRVHGENEFRIFYVAKFAEAVYVLHGFTKKTRTTRKADIDTDRRRYAELLEVRKKEQRRR